MKYFLIVFLAVLAVVTDNVAEHYNNEELCPANLIHISCENPELFEPPSNVRLLNSDDFKSHILHLHNKYRNLAAAGVHKLSPACQMMAMKWDDDLEDLAKLNLLTCNRNGEECRHTPDYPNAGQNVGSLMANLNTIPTVIIDAIILQWFEEGKEATKALIANYQAKSLPQKVFPNFATMILDTNSRLGCAMAAVPFDDTMLDYLLTCSYAQAPVNYTKIYEECDQRDCYSAQIPDFPNLCEVDILPLKTLDDYMQALENII